MILFDSKEDAGIFLLSLHPDLLPSTLVDLAFNLMSFFQSVSANY
ncbi:MAG: hypothetical protein AAF383_05130 [Cyanobacteria bacterium P01_A01_bin.83]